MGWDRLQTILQSYSNQDSMVLAQKQKYRSMGILRQNIRETGHFKDLVINTSIREGEKPSNITG